MWCLFAGVRPTDTNPFAFGVPARPALGDAVGLVAAVAVGFSNQFDVRRVVGLFVALGAVFRIGGWVGMNATHLRPVRE